MCVRREHCHTCVAQYITENDHINSRYKTMSTLSVKFGELSTIRTLTPLDMVTFLLKPLSINSADMHRGKWVRTSLKAIIWNEYCYFDPESENIKSSPLCQTRRFLMLPHYQMATKMFCFKYIVTWTRLLWYKLKVCKLLYHTNVYKTGNTCTICQYFNSRKT